ncbi:MAG TPA: ROK family protein, partial [Candidatus Nanoarchaeia archaeon]|nr:ROK family protein [Candidatus Nanoarchaeia archaeon]
KDAATWDIIARDMAVGLSGLIAITAPDKVVLGGGVSVHYNRFKKPLAKYLEHYGSRLYPMPPVLPAKRVERAALDGALILARRAK